MVIKISKVHYEDALDMTGWGKFNILLFGLCCSIITAMVFEIYSVSYIVPASVCELKTTSTQQGLIAGLPLAGIIMTSHLWGHLADKYGRRKVLCLSMTIGFIAGSLATLSPNWITVCVLKFVSCAAVSGAVLSHAFLGECTPSKQRSILLILSTSSFLLSTGLMAVISMPVLPLKFSYYIPYLDIHFNSWRLLNFIYSIPCALCAVGTLCTWESPKYLLSIGDEKETMKVLKSMYVMNSGKSEMFYEVDSVVLGEDNGASKNDGFFKSIITQSLPLFRPPLLKGTLLLASLFILVFICINSLIVWLPFMIDAFMSSVEDGATGLTICGMIRLARNNYTNMTSNIEETSQDCSLNNTAMTMVLGINVILAVLNVIVGLMSSYVGKRRIFISIQILSGVAALCINVSSSWIISALLLFIVMFEIINFGFLSLFTIDVFPTYVKAKAICLLIMMGRGSTIVGINVLKQLLEYNCELGFYITGFLTLSASVIAFLLPADPSLWKKNKQNN